MAISEAESIREKWPEEHQSGGKWEVERERVSALPRLAPKLKPSALITFLRIFIVPFANAIISLLHVSDISLMSEVCSYGDIII